MIKWEYKELPDIDWDRDEHDDTYYSPRVLAMVNFTSHFNKPEPRFGTYIRKEKGNGYWAIEGMSGTIRVHAWSYITPIKT